MCSESWLIVDLNEDWLTPTSYQCICTCVHTHMCFLFFFVLYLGGSWIQFWDGTRTCQNIHILLCIYYGKVACIKKNISGQNLHERNLFGILVLRKYKKIKLRKKTKEICLYHLCFSCGWGPIAVLNMLEITRVKTLKW